MTSNCSPLAPRAAHHLEKGKEHETQAHVHRAAYHFNKAVQHDGALAEEVAGYHQARGDARQACGDIKAARYYHQMAKHQYKRLALFLPPGPRRGAALLQVGAAHYKLSQGAIHGYSSRHNARAIHYFNQALENLQESGEAARDAHAGRCDAYVQRFSTIIARPWFHLGSHNDAQAYLGAIQDLSALLPAPRNLETHKELLLLAKVLFESPMDATSQQWVQQRIVPSLRESLFRTTPNPDAVACQTAALAALGELIAKQRWAAPCAFAVLHAFVDSGQVHRSQLEAVAKAYRGVIKTTPELATTAVHDLARLHQNFFASPDALQHVLGLCKTFIDAHHTVGPAVSILAMAQAARVGVGSNDVALQSKAEETVNRAAQIFPDIALLAIEALTDFAIALNGPPAHPNRQVVRQRIVDDLFALRTSDNPAIVAGVHRALVERLGENMAALAAAASAAEAAAAELPTLPVRPEPEIDTPPRVPPVIPRA